jgi:hypothetical protein
MKINKYKILVKYNYILSKRVKNWDGFYILITISLSLIMSCLSYYLFILNFQENEIDLRIILSVVLFLILIIEIMLITFRYSSNTIILPNQLIFYPISTTQKFNFILFSQLYDIKFISFLIPIIIISIGLFNSKIVLGIFLIIIFSLFYICIEVWLVDLFLISFKQFDKKRDKLQIVFSTLLIIFILLNTTESYHVFLYFPISGWVGQGIYFAHQGELTLAMGYLIILILFLGLGLVIGKTMLKKSKSIYY